ncbi:hypothetical protein [uncultured Tessaracoccus sp.]|uniref:hypothetical protein n=1 Tax=uncultured Tessaracoccus sp. TaxID=905023 RepID=UPI002607CBF7|nr:hypothetical protein [uncultured Tessaracoccus sp.]
MQDPQLPQDPIQAPGYVFPTYTRETSQPMGLLPLSLIAGGCILLGLALGLLVALLPPSLGVIGAVSSVSSLFTLIGEIAAGMAIYESFRRSPGSLVIFGGVAALVGVVIRSFAFSVLDIESLTLLGVSNFVSGLLTTAGVTTALLGLWRPRG